MTTNKTIGATAGLALAALALTGCVVVEAAPKDEAPRQSPATSAPEPRNGSAPSGAEEHRSTESDESASPKAEIVDLASETGTVYVVANRSGGLLSPPKVVGPWLTYWHVDGERITYQEVLCTGQVVTEASGRLGDEQVLWDGVDPWIGDADSEASSMKKTDSTIRVGFTETAGTGVAAAKDEFTALCTDAGETVADFVVG